jgi:class 3 adenylate cyclase/tetratricopeptide (TPR) repeat protein
VTVRACPKCGQDNPDTSRFCGACGSPLDAVVEEPPPEEERKVVTALFTDIVGSTASAEQLDPEDVRARLAPYYSRVRRELESFGGTVEKFIGDAVVALFGAPVAHEDDPERAVRAALAINEAISELNEQKEWLDIHIRTAVHTGEALVVLGAKAVEGEGMAAGDVMNTAARLQGSAPVDGVVVGEATYRATAHIFEYREAEPVQAKGKAEPIPVWEVVVERAVPESRAARTPLVGRRAELVRLAEVWQAVLDERRPRLVTLLGPPGIGKSRLLLALREHVEETATVHSGRCLPYGEGMTYWPLTEIIKSAAGIRHDDDAVTGSAKLGRLLESLPTHDEDELRTIAAALAHVVGITTTPHGTYSAEVISQAELHWAIRRVLPLLARQRPMVLVFEDLHWAEPTLIELLQELPHAEGEAAFLIVGSARPELAESQPGFVANVDGRESISLSPLSEDEIEELLTELLADTPIGSAQLQRLVRNAGGNPLFLEETVRMVAEAKDEGDRERLPVPETIQALIGARLDTLTARDKRVVQQASVVGTVFWPGAVAHIGGLDGDLAPSLDTLERRDFIRCRPESSVVGEREYEFKHILIRDVAYERLPKGRRAELHVGFVPWLRELESDDEFVEIEAYHLEQACLLARALARSPIELPVLEAAGALSRAGEKAERREGTREADRYFGRAIELVGSEYPEKSVELRLRRGGTRVRLGDLSYASEELAAVAHEALVVGRPDLRGEALVLLAGLDHRQGRAREARERLSEAQGLAAESSDRRLQVRMAFLRSTLQAEFDGESAAAAEQLRHAIATAHELDDRRLLVMGHLRMAFILFNMGDLGSAEQELTRCIELAAQLGSLQDQSRATFLLGLAKYYRGDREEAERLNLQARDWLERTGETFFQIQNFRALGLYALARDDLQAAEHWLREALPVALEEGGRPIFEVYRFLVEALARQGRTEDAARLLDFACRNMPAEDVVAQAYVLLAEAEVAAETGDAASARTRYDEGVARLDEHGLPIEAGEARMRYARLLQRLGESEDARLQLELARAALESAGASGLVDEVDREVEQLPSGAGSAGPARSASAR